MGSNYFTLDLKQTLTKLEKDPIGFLDSNRGNPLVIDECQLSPDLFPALKEFVRVNKKPEQFLITGSVRFTSRKAIRESLTGRIINWELLPMDYCELKGLPLADTGIRFIQAKNVEVDLRGKTLDFAAEVPRFLMHGGLPGVFSVRNDALRAQKYESQLESLLDRDLRLVSDTSLSLRAITSFAQYLASNQGSALNLAEGSRATRISIPTLRKLLSAFESIFLIRVYETEGGQKAPVVYFEDQGEASYLSSKERSELQQLEHYIYANLRTQWHYRPELRVRMSQYRTRGGALVPFVLRSSKGVLGIIPTLEENPGPSAYGSGTSFLKENSSAKVLYVHLGKKDQLLNKRERSLPVSSLVV